MRDATTGPWVVYRMPMKYRPEGIRGVCEQAEWEAMELANPGVNTLIQASIASEGEAEQLARGSSGQTRPRTARRALTSWPEAAIATLAADSPPAAG